MPGRANISDGTGELHDMKNIRWISLGYIAAAAALLLFSYTQVDLNLTLSRASFVQTVEKAFQYVGFYQRPLATFLYGTIITALFLLYGALLTHAKRGDVSQAFVWRIIFVVTGILVCSYPAAFSYDFFNYLFTAKTVLVYHQNPYTVTPLQYASIDPWTNFMRWTHLSSAYTPLWILLSLVPYVTGLGVFILVLFATKSMIAAFYLLACWALVRVLENDDRKEVAYGLVLFALNPLILIESLVSGHNDIVLAAFALLAVFMYVKKTSVAAWLFLSLSIAAKFMTIFLIPVFWLKRGKEWMLGAMAIGLALVLFRREFLPWYWVWILPFVVLNLRDRTLVRFAVIVSFALVASYAPYLYFGEYSAAEQVWKTSIIWIGTLAAAISLLDPRGKRRSSS